MRLIKQTTLYFREKTSDKVYEVDLCEADEGEFLVNFRYGRRGARLKDGTKTPFPESLEKAEAIFAKLVLSKTRKGYQEAAHAADRETTSEQPQPPKDVPLGTPKQRAATKRRLEQASSRDWPLTRVVWRTGELGLTESAKAVQALSGKGALDDYVVAWTLGKLGSLEGVDTLREFRNGGQAAVRRIAGEALLQCLSGEEKRAIEATLESALPEELLHLLDKNSATILGWLQSRPDLVMAPANTLYDLYALAERHPNAREAVYDFIRPLPMQAPWFRSIRHVFKAAEFRLDGEMYGLIAHKFEKSTAGFRPDWGGKIWISGKRKAVSEVLSDPTSKHAFSVKTRAYLRRRVVRDLRRAAELDDMAKFITLATGVLLAYRDDEDRLEPEAVTEYRYDHQTRRSHKVTRHFDCYAPYLPLNYLLYQNSPRYERRSPVGKWRCREHYQPNSDIAAGSVLPEIREDAFPELWDRAPDAIGHLLQHSACAAVHEFAVKVWRCNPGFDEHCDQTLIVAMLKQPYTVTQQLALDLARKCYDPDAPDITLLVALLACDLEEARRLAEGWLIDGKSSFIDHANLLAEIALIPFEDVHRALRDVLTLAKPSSPETLRALSGKVIAGLLALPDTESETARLARETLTMTLVGALSQISYEIVADLLQHVLTDVQLLGAQIVSKHPDSRDEIPDSIWEGMLMSDHEPVRRVGMELFSELSDTALLEKAEVLANFCISERADLRQDARPIVQRLAKCSPGFAQDIVLQFYPIVLRKESYDGLHDDVYQLLEGPLGEHLHVIPADSCIRMMESRYAAGQKLGFLILKKYVGLDSQPMAVIAHLGGQDLLAGREHVWEFYRQHSKRIKEEKVDALRIVDASWQDTRDFAFEFFEAEFAEHDWSPELLVSICDSVRGDVADFGRRLITRFFHKEDGPEYLMKLSQHPTAEMQSFASSYLDRFASDNLARLRELEGYFITVLSLVNRGRVAKARTLQFLANEAEKSDQAAAFVASILTRQTVTVAIHDKAACIRILHRIQQRYPNVETPLRRRDIAIYTPA